MATMEQLTLQLRETAREILESKKAAAVIGWEKGTFWYTTTPVVLTKPEDTERLVWNEYCLNNLAKYLLDFQHSNEKVAIFARGCDSRGINRLIQDKQIDRDKVLIIGLACPGMKDDKKARELGQNADIPLAKKCQECAYPDALVYDLWIGEPKEVAKPVPEAKVFPEVEAIEQMTPDDKYASFAANYEKCLRCYACRNVCPACNCKECIFGNSSKEWSAKANNLSENMFFALTRALHVAGRCIQCGECERICPVNIPIMLLNKKIIQDIDRLFGPYEAGLDPEDKMPLGSFEFTDPEEFM